MESDVRFYRRRANEELAAANRAITAAARDRRMRLADSFLQRLKAVEPADLPVFGWAEQGAAHHV